MITFDEPYRGTVITIPEKLISTRSAGEIGIVVILYLNIFVVGVLLSPIFQ